LSRNPPDGMFRRGMYVPPCPPPVIDEVAFEIGDTITSEKTERSDHRKDRFDQ